MKKTLLILAAALSGALAASAQTGREWQDPAVNEINRLPMHSTFAAGESMPEHPRLRGELWLERGGSRYRLEFDCDRCEMSLVDCTKTKL